jgi:hypothetical protein
MVKEKHAEEIREMFGDGKRPKKGKKVRTKSSDLVGLVSRKTPLYRTYKGKEYKAYLYPSGTIKLGNKSFTSPTAAAVSIIDRSTVNGWWFWNLKDQNGDWVKLKDLRK